MLKQLFNYVKVLQVITSRDVWRWNILSDYGDVETAAKLVAKELQDNGFNIASPDIKNIKGRKVFIPKNLKDHLAIKLVDHYLRRIYKVRQSDRDRVVRQIITLMKDPAALSFIRIDIKNCYESIVFETVLEKLKQDMILAPKCLIILDSLSRHLKAYNYSGLPRGLSISATLAELYLEKLDKKISANKEIIYMARYVDDIVVVTENSLVSKILSDLKHYVKELLLEINEDNDKLSIYSADQESGKLEMLGYSFTSSNEKKNKVFVEISEKKINKIKKRILLCLFDFRKEKNFKLLKERIYYLSSLKIIKKTENGNILSGNAFNYKYADDFKGLKSVDGFYLSMLTKQHFQLSSVQVSQLKKISFYRMAKKRKVMNVTKNRASSLQKAWANVE